MSAFPSSSIGLPRSLDYNLPPSASENARSYSICQSPDGITQVSAPNQNLFIAGQASQGQFNSQLISFTIPSGNAQSVFIDPSATTLSFSLTYVISTSAVSAVAPVCKLLSSAASFFSSLVLFSNNTPLETVNGYDLLQNFLLQNTVSLSERNGGIGQMGCDTIGANGIDLAYVAGTYRYNFCIPLISMIGLNSDKLFPVGCVNNLTLQMTTQTILPISASVTTITTNPVFTQPFTLSEFSLNMKYVDIGEMASSMLMASLPDNRILYKSSSYTNSQVTIPNGSSGSQQLLLQIRNTSVKSIYSQFGMSNSVQAQSLVSPNGYFDAINIGTSSRQLQIGGNFIPSRPFNDISRSSEGYVNGLLMSLGGSIPKSLGTAVSKEQYNSLGGTTLPTGANVETYLVLPANYSRGAPTGSDNLAVSVFGMPSGHFHGYDLERMGLDGGILFSGINTRSTPPFLNLTIQNALNATVTCNAWGYSDVVLVFDIASKSVQAFI